MRIDLRYGKRTPVVAGEPWSAWEAWLDGERCMEVVHGRRTLGVVAGDTRGGWLLLEDGTYLRGRVEFVSTESGRVLR